MSCGDIMAMANAANILLSLEKCLGFFMLGNYSIDGMSTLKA
jgi:hypothetical protein